MHVSKKPYKLVPMSKTNRHPRVQSVVVVDTLELRHPTRNMDVLDAELVLVKHVS